MIGSAKKIAVAVEVLHKGSKLSKVETWKNRQLALSLIVAVLSGLSFLAFTFGWIPNEIPAEAIAEWSSLAVTIGLLIISYLTPATSEKVGLPPKHRGKLVRESDSVFNDSSFGELRDTSRAVTEDEQRMVEDARSAKSGADRSRETWLGG